MEVALLFHNKKKKKKKKKKENHACKIIMKFLCAAHAFQKAFFTPGGFTKAPGRQRSIFLIFYSVKKNKGN